MSEEPTRTVTAPPAVANVFSAWKTVILHPKQFFESMPLTGGIGQPLLFVACTSAFAALGVIVGDLGQPLVAFQAAWKAFIGAIVGSFLGSFVTWILCKLFGGKGNYEQTYRACAYSTAPHVFAVIGRLGWIGTPYSIYLLFLGLKRSHELSSGKAAAVIAIELLAAVGIMIVLAGLLAALLFHR